MTGQTALLVTTHFYAQGRRGSMHWLADELVKKGWKVRFLTFGYSYVSRLTGDVRLSTLESEPRQGQYLAAPGVEQIFHYTLYHPVDLRFSLANIAAKPLFQLFPQLWRKRAAKAAAGADLIVLESGLPVLLAPLLRRMPAKLIYRVNDDIRVMRTPPLLKEVELQYAPMFDRVSLASPVLAQRFAEIAKVGLDPMGLDRTAFQRPNPDPYGQRWEREVVCAGTSHFDRAAVLDFATRRPTWRFHIIGRLRSPLDGPTNIIAHGELPFDSVVPFVQHADIGLAPYLDIPGVEYQAHHSNRLQQYAFCRLPTLAPRRMLHPTAPFLVGYDVTSPVSMEIALRQVENFDRTALTGETATWTDLCDGILKVMSR